MLASAGGSVLTPDAAHVSLGKPAIKALTIMKRLATSVAADPSLDVQQENDNRLAMEARDSGLPAELPVRLSVDEGRQPEDVQELQVGALSRR